MPKFFYALAAVLFVVGIAQFVTGGDGAGARGFACLACGFMAVMVATNKLRK